jgi:hypothetical protein
LYISLVLILVCIHGIPTIRLFTNYTRKNATNALLIFLMNENENAFISIDKLFIDRFQFVGLCASISKRQQKLDSLS